MKSLRNVEWGVALFLLTTVSPAPGQVQAGQLSTNLAGTVSGGYTADYGNVTPSDRAVAFAGTADLTGFYYDPKFLSFDVHPYYNQSRANSDFQSIIGASGVSASTSIFGGSNFPGSISYSKAFSSSGNFGLPGLADYTTHGDSDTLNVTWSERVPNLPAASVGYQQGSNQSSIYGALGDIDTRFHAVNANVSDTLAGFNLTGSYHYLTNHLQLPEFLGGAQSQRSQSESQSYAAGIGHALPFRGSFSAAANRSDFASTYSGGQYSGTLDTLSAGVSFRPLNQLHFGSNAQYTDNLFESLSQAIITAGGILPGGASPQSSHSLDVTAYANYEIPTWHMTLNGTDEHRDQRLFGWALSSNALTGTATYANQLYGGSLTAMGGFNKITVMPNNQSRAGFVGLVNYMRNIRRWVITASVNYAQNVETFLISYTTNSYGYSGTLSRRIRGHSNWSLMASGSKTSLNEQNGSSSFSQTYSTTLSLRRISGSAAYSRSSGNAILTGSGLVPTPILVTAVTPSDIILYGGHSYSASLATTPFRGLTLSASYARAQSSTSSSGLGSANRSEQVNARMQYLIRKIYFQAGYLRFTQAFSASTAGPVAFNSLYVGLSRWFNFF
ncbi:MAG: hypothetical protein U0Q18_03815 [Bryobacteraceae bacterium]